MKLYPLILGLVVFVRSLTAYGQSVPTIDCPRNFIVWTCATGAEVNFNVTARANCGAIAGITCSPPSGSVLPIGVQTISCTARDTCGLSRTCSFSATVRRDTNAPVILCPADLTVACLADVPPRPATLADFLALGGAGQRQPRCEPGLYLH